MSDQGCQDGNCILRIGPMVGQHTNAGCHCLSRLPVELRQAVERKIQTQHREIRKLQSEVARITDQVRYWSYCISQGMRATCPEKVEELAAFLIDLKIAPYYVRNNALETVSTTDGGAELKNNVAGDVSDE